MYEVFLEQRIERDLKRLGAKEFQRITHKIKALADNPRPVGCRKIAGSKKIVEFELGTIGLFMRLTKKQKRSE